MLYRRGGRDCYGGGRDSGPMRGYHTRGGGGGDSRPDYDYYSRRSPPPPRDHYYDRGGDPYYRGKHVIYSVSVKVTV